MRSMPGRPPSRSTSATAARTSSRSSTTAAACRPSMRGWPSTATPRARSAPWRTSMPCIRSDSAARPSRRSPRSRRSSSARGRRATRWAPRPRSTAGSSPRSSRCCAPWGRSSSCATSSTTSRRGVASWTRAPRRRRRSGASSSVSRCATPRWPSSSMPTTLRSIRCRPRRLPGASSTSWDAISSRTSWRSRPTPRSPASQGTSDVPPRPRNAIRSSTCSSTGAISGAPTCRAPSSRRMRN